MRLVVGVTLGVVGVFLMGFSLLLALTGAVWDIYSPILGDSVTGPTFPDKFPAGVLLVGVPFGAILIVLGYRVGRVKSDPRVERP